MIVLKVREKCCFSASRFFVVLLLLVSVSLVEASDTPQYIVTVLKDVKVPMRDGIELSTDIYFPAGLNGNPISDRLPSILTRTPYSKNGYEESAFYFASRGYVFIAQDTRGRYKSDGVWHMLTDDGEDGVDTCAWIGQQLWSNGHIGMIGTSYVGGTQHAIAMEKAPELSTVIPVDAMSNLGYQSLRNVGAFELRFWNWIFTRAADGSRQAREPSSRARLEQMAENRKYYLLNLPTRRNTTPLRFAPEYESWLVSVMEHGVDDDHWSQNNIRGNASSYKDIPVYLVGGWYDSWAGNTSTNYKELTKFITGPVYLIMGPWIHGRQNESTHGQVSFGVDAAIADPLAWRLEWYDHWLKDIDNSVGKGPLSQVQYVSSLWVRAMEKKDGWGSPKSWRLLAR